jgi:hypothetical protein
VEPKGSQASTPEVRRAERDGLDDPDAAADAVSRPQRRAGDPRADHGPPWARLTDLERGQLVRLAGNLQRQLKGEPGRAGPLRDGLASIKGILEGERAAERAAADGAGFGAHKTFLLGLLRDGVDPKVVEERAGVPGGIVDHLAKQVADEPAPPATPGAEWHRARRAAAATRLLAGDSPGKRAQTSRETGLPERTVGGIADALRAVRDFDNWPPEELQAAAEQQRLAALWLLDANHPPPLSEISKLLGMEPDAIGALDRERQNRAQPLRWKRGEVPELILQVAGELLGRDMRLSEVGARLNLSRNSVALLAQDLRQRRGSPQAKQDQP